MSVNFGWNDSYSVGIEEIDSQHKRFLSIIQQLHETKQEDSSISNLRKLIEELEKYLIFHTKSEEMLMLLYEYPQQDIQKKEHREVIEKVQDKIEKMPDNINDLNDLLIYLMQWFVKHTTYLDKELGTFINEKRSR